MLTEHPAPAVIPLNEQQFAFAREGTLAIQTCPSCGGYWYLPSTHCPTCLSEDVRWVAASGRGTLWSWIVVHQPYLAAVTDEIPYVVAVELEEGPVIMSTITGTPREELAFDAPPIAEFVTVGSEELPMPVFRVAP